MKMLVKVPLIAIFLNSNLFKYALKARASKQIEKANQAT